MTAFVGCRSPKGTGRVDPRPFEFEIEHDVAMPAPTPDFADAAAQRRYCRFVGIDSPELKRHLPRSAWDVAVIACEVAPRRHLEIRLIDANHGAAILASARLDRANGLVVVILALRRKGHGAAAGASPESFLAFEVVEHRVDRIAATRIPSLDTGWMREHLADYDWFPFGQPDRLGLAFPESWNGKYEQGVPVELDATDFTKVLRWCPVCFDDPVVVASDE